MKNIAESKYWADQKAREIIAERGNKKLYVFAAGITPSGTIHIGNFREVITVDLIARALKSLGKQVRFIYSWDDADRFRKVPLNMPNRDLLATFLGRSVSDIPDPFGSCHKSYALHLEDEFESSLKDVEIKPEFIRQSKMYAKRAYANEIRAAMRARDKIRDILDQYRKEPLSRDWWPIQIYCPKCHKDCTHIVEYDDNFQVKYRCDCGFEENIDFRKASNLAMRWRVDWPMRWYYEKVDFEPGGKEHSTPGGSRTTSVIITKEVYDNQPPVYQMYDYIIIKGSGGKMSSSTGKVYSLAEVLKVYTPEIVRFLFAGTKPIKEFSISFDEDVLKVYEDFYKVERIYFGEQDASDRDREHWSRVYEMSCPLEPPKKMPIQPNFKHCVELINIANGDVKAALARVKKLENLDPRGVARYKALLPRAKFWVENHAPESYRFTVNEKPIKVEMSDSIREGVAELRAFLSKNRSAEKITDEMYRLLNKYNFEHREFYIALYQLLINQNHGPRLAPFIKAIGQETTVNLLKSGKSRAKSRESADTGSIKVILDEDTKPSKLVVGQRIITDLENKKNRNKKLDKMIRVLEDEVKKNPKKFLEIPDIKAYKDFIKTAPKSVESDSSAAEILVNLILKNGHLPSISRVVDCMNFVSVKYGVTVSIWDAQKIEGNITYKLSKGGEKYWPFMGDEIELLKGELIAVDDKKVLCLVRYRDSKYAPVTTETKEIVIHIQGVNGISQSKIESALNELEKLILDSVGGTVKY